MINQILYTACVTPFTKEGIHIDYTSLERLIRTQDRVGNGLVMFGSTGEGLSISFQEKKNIMEFICGLKLSTNIIVGVPNYNFTEALEWISYCNEFPVNGYLMTTPVYTKPGILGQTKWFEGLLEHSKFPAMIYNIPSRSAVRLHPETVKNLASHPRFVAIKDSGGSVDSMIDYQIVAPNIAMYCGDDYLMTAMASEGAVGLVSIASNAWPDAMRYYVMESLDGNLKSDSNKIWWKAFRAFHKASNPIPIKALLKKIGLIENDTVRIPLCREDLKSIEELFFYHEVVTDLVEDSKVA